MVNASTRFINLSDGYLTLDSGIQGVGVSALTRAFQLNIGGITQLQLQPGTSIVGNGTGVLGVDTYGNIFWTSGAGGSGNITVLEGDVTSEPAVSGVAQTTVGQRKSFLFGGM